MTLEELEAYDAVDLVAAVKKAGGQRAFARKHGIARSTLQHHLYRSRKDPFTHRPAPSVVEVADTLRPGEVARFILTSAQDSTSLHLPFLKNLEAYRDWLSRFGSCEVMIAGFTYNKSLFEDHAKIGVVWPTEIMPYMSNERVRIADAIDWCGEMNTLPTAVNPLSGFKAYTRHRWGIFPHAKVQLQSVATQAHKPAKLIMTTGAVTRPNYVPKKAGIKASFDHIFGAVLVEVDAYGHYFCRHLIGDESDGSFYDLDRHVAYGAVTTGHRLKCLTPGDVHVAQIDPQVSATTFGLAPTEERDAGGGRVWERQPGSMLDVLRPEFLFLHDSFDGRRRNHHSINDPHDRFHLWSTGEESVEGECRETAFFINAVQRPETKVVVVESNHDLVLNKWIKSSDYKSDPVNAIFYLDCARAIYSAIAAGEKDFSIFQEVMQNAFPEFPCADVEFLREDDSFLVDQVEHANHGHNGANGARGNIRQFAESDSKNTVGHAHSCGWIGGTMQTGTSSLMKLGYNKGLGSWSHSHAAQYQSGKRTLITLQDGLYCLPCHVH